MIASPWPGLLLASLLVFAWLLSLAALISLNLLDWTVHPGSFLVFTVVAILARTLLQTGLFIVAHDAMHGLLYPARPGLNRLMGKIFLGLYAGLSFQSCSVKHLNHHHDPASPFDPDFHHGDDRFFAWYRLFMVGYLSLPQLSFLLSGWLLLWLGTCSITPTALANLGLFAVLPLLLSSLQLFAVGTYWPHRGQDWHDPGHRCRNLDWPGWLSLLACFHFGYHLEHHSNPQLAWFELPRCRRVQVAQGSGPPFQRDLNCSTGLKRGA